MEITSTPNQGLEKAKPGEMITLSLYRTGQVIPGPQSFGTWNDWLFGSIVTIVFLEVFRLFGSTVEPD